MAEKTAPVKIITEFALRTRSSEGDQGVFSHASEAVVRHKRDGLIVRAVDAGLTVPTYELVRRVCRYPLDADGKMIARESTVTETVLD